MNLDELKALPATGKAYMRRAVRRQLSQATREMLKPHGPENRAFLSGYVEHARKALEALR
jgi:hypothetical protein